MFFPKDICTKWRTQATWTWLERTELELSLTLIEHAKLFGEFNKF